jgi:hypothetical protein
MDDDQSAPLFDLTSEAPMLQYIRNRRQSPNIASVMDPTGQGLRS